MKERLKENMMEHPYEIGVGPSRSRPLLGSGALDPADPAYRSVPRVQTAHSGIRTKSYNSLQPGGGGYGGRGHSANPRMGQGASKGQMPLI